MANSGNFGAHVTPEIVKAGVARVLAVAGWVSVLTPTKVDDNIVAALGNLNEQVWFHELLAQLMNMFENSHVVGNTEDKVRDILKNLEI